MSEKLTHAIVRTNRIGQPLIGVCINCGKQNLRSHDALEECPGGKYATQEEALTSIIGGDFDQIEPHSSDFNGEIEIWANEFGRRRLALSLATLCIVIGMIIGLLGTVSLFFTDNPLGTFLILVGAAIVLSGTLGWWLKGRTKP